VAGVVGVTAEGGREPVPPPSHAAAVAASRTSAVPRQLVLVRFIGFAGLWEGTARDTRAVMESAPGRVLLV
jgi:hypothetical protein